MFRLTIDHGPLPAQVAMMIDSADPGGGASPRCVTVEAPSMSELLALYRVATGHELPGADDWYEVKGGRLPVASDPRPTRPPSRTGNPYTDPRSD